VKKAKPDSTIRMEKPPKKLKVSAAFHKDFIGEEQHDQNLIIPENGKCK